MTVISAAGTGASTWLNGMVDVGRAAVAAGDAGVAHLEWSDLDGAVDDPATSRRAHPALGHTITEADLAAELAAGMDPAEFARAYLAHDTAALRYALDLDTFAAAGHARAAPSDRYAWPPRWRG